MIVADRNRFLPNAGQYMRNVIDGKSNGPEKDRAFGWKQSADLANVQSVSASVVEWRDLQDGRSASSVTAKL